MLEITFRLMPYPTKKLGEILLWIILLVVIILPILYVFFCNLNLNFWDSVATNLIATGLALIAGIPIAFWVDRQLKHREGENKYREDRLRETRILVLIKEELDFSLNSLFLNGKRGNKESLTIQPLKSDLWDAFIAGEDVKYIEEPELLNRIASAYYVLKIVKNIEYQAHIAFRTSAISFTLSDGIKKNSAQLLLEDARGFDKLFEDSVKEAIKMVDGRLGVLKKYAK